MYRPLVTLAALLALTSCSSPAPTSVGLKDSCDALGVVLQDFGQVAPTAQRYADYLPKVKAIQDRGDATTKEALQPLVAAMDKGAQGDTSVTFGAHLAATVGLMAQCATVGSTGLAPASSTPSPSATAAPLPAEDYHAELVELERSCTGDACMVDARVGVGYIGVEDDPGRARVTFTVSGGSKTETRSLIVSGDEVNTIEISASVPKGGKLRVSVERVERA